MAVFDQRAASYDKQAWHVRYAERLVELAAPAAGMRVLDAATGTGLAAIAAARAVGPSGHVTGVDISSGMLARAQQSITAPNVDLLLADASDLPRFGDGSFDLVLCSAGLLYMPVRTALEEWLRLLVPNGLVAFSTMRAGFPVAARLFRELAARYGLTLTDPALPLGSPARCRSALTAAGFTPVEEVVETIRFSPADLDQAWEAHTRGPHHAAMTLLTPDQVDEFRTTYTTALAALVRSDPDTTLAPEVIYALARRPITR
ncbi:class I SAM-dependent methyltransferase [Actinoplanes palleronii]|uniref:Methyltransferase domain-containing protein n=1 Tax=Actinoplanes palleronii TaxID=113570 RepID=A0ABQ4BH48_9ACTN|nr:methyltransferase domain-containing protein [Actinoplanes palleronii]GIE70009.1 hypothetical protein Apa02nite_061170 [Actinoplanes palleronii]